MSSELFIAILAAGASRRLGQPKQLVLLDGEPLLHRLCRTAIEAGIGQVAAILGCRAIECRRAIADLSITQVLNEEWSTGMASSLRTAAQMATKQNAQGLMIVHCDQFRLEAEDLRQLARSWQDAGRTSACRSADGDYRGPPVIFPASSLSIFSTLRRESGARSVLELLGQERVIDVVIPHASIDLDTPEQLLHLR